MKAAKPPGADERKTPKPQAVRTPPPFASKDNRRLGAQNRKLLGKHYANKYGVRKG